MNDEASMYCSNPESLKTTLRQMQDNPNVLSLLLFVAEKDLPPKKELETILKENSKPLIGGIFPEIIADGIRRNSGFLLVPLCFKLEPLLIDLGSDENAISSALNRLPDSGSYSSRSIFCFTDALAPMKSRMIEMLYDHCGPGANYVGGGAGSLSFKPVPCIIHQHQLVGHAAVIGSVNTRISVGVAHGWIPVSDLIKVTETRGNTILSLNWKPAFEVYRQHIREHSGSEISSGNFFDIAKSYPLGLVRLESEMIIRDPFATENGWLHIVDEVPEGEYIRIMNGNMESLLNGATAALQKAAVDADHGQTEHFCVDCISRVLYMQDEFIRELALLNSQKPINGVLSIGEIANPGDAILELFNKTIVVAKWTRKN